MYYFYQAIDLFKEKHVYKRFTHLEIKSPNITLPI